MAEFSWWAKLFSSLYITGNTNLMTIYSNLKLSNGKISIFIEVYLFGMHFFSFLIMMKTGGQLPKEDIISNHGVHSKLVLDCVFKCIPSSTCVGFNYRPMRSNKYAVNCQLSKTINPRDQETGAKGEWTFHKDLHGNGKKNILRKF